MPKQSKSEVDYTPKAKNPNEQCDKCVHFYIVGFYSAGRCTQVEGEISHKGWCKKFKAK